MNNNVKKIAAATAGSALALAGVAGAALATDVPVQQPAPQTAEHVLAADSQNVLVPNVQGAFAYNQAEVDSNAQIARAMGDAAKYLCGSQYIAGDEAAAEDWVISVGGAVEHPYSATIGELVEHESAEHVVMGCSCAGNPADGRASVNAEVTGVSVLCIIGEAGVSDEANTIVFTSADGYEVALPLWYVAQRYCPIVFDVNGSPLIDSVGGTNQLWLGASSAKYFVRDVTSITLECRDVVPEAPGAGDAAEGANLPNVGVYFGGTVA